MPQLRECGDGRSRRGNMGRVPIRRFAFGGPHDVREALLKFVDEAIGGLLRTRSA